MKNTIEKMLLTPLMAGVMLVLVGCGFPEPARVQNDFGNSVRNMVAAQIYDPATASAPQELGPEELSGNAAEASIAGYEAASRGARQERTTQNNSPLPVVGTVQNSE